MASFSVPSPKCPSTSSSSSSSSSPPLGLKSQNLSFQNGLSLKPSLSFGSLFAESAASRIQCLNRKQFSVLKATKVENSNSAPVTVNGPNVASSDEKQVQNGKHSGGTLPDEASIIAFMSQVSDLVKLVDSRDIVELQLKQSDCELMIRKKEALEPPPVIAPASPPMHYATLPSPPPPTPPAASASSSPPKATPSLPSPGKPSSSSYRPLKCPMAGTFYRSPAPGEPPFVKVGDKVKKGQVVCIIEAMKLMNEIEADQSGTIAEMLVEDGKPVSVDTTLFSIAP